MIQRCDRTFVVLSLMLGSFSIARADDAPFREYLSTEARFRVEMPQPANPEETTDEESFKIRSVSAKADGIEYSVKAIEAKIPLPDRDPQELIKELRASIRKDAAFHKDDKEILLGKEKFPGRAYRMALPGKEPFTFEFVREQIVAAGKRIYVVTASTDRVIETLDSEPVNRFFSSFTIDPPEKSHETEVVSAEGRFRVTLPAKPYFKIEDGKNAKVYRWVMRSGEAYYSVSYLDLTTTQRGDIDPREWLKQFRKRSRPTATFDDEKEISSGPNKVPGLEYLAVITNKKNDREYVREQMFLDGNRLYMIYADLGVFKFNSNIPRVEKFFSTLQITR